MIFIINTVFGDLFMAQYVRPTLEQTLFSGSAAGTFGKYNKVAAVTGTWYNTGSNAGGAAIIKGTTAAGGMTASLGGAINLADIAATQVFEIEPRFISASAGTVYVLYRNNGVI